jgi:poly(3-hydroxybutyrate) depolymerase
LSLAIAAAAIALTVWLTVLPGAVQRRDSLALVVLKIDIMHGPIVPVVYGLSLLAAVALVARRWQPRRLMVVLLGAAVGAAASIGVLEYAQLTDAFGVALEPAVWAWGIAVSTGIGVSMCTLWNSSGLRRMVASVAVVLFLASGTVGVNAAFGLDSTVADLAGIPIAKPVRLPKVVARVTQQVAHDPALWANWRPPRTMPAVGTTGQVSIPATISGFRARPAGIYLPPAALVANPPALPLVIMMMGQPGNPDPSFTAAILNEFAAHHDGLAPIVLVPDQLGDPSVDPLCLDTTRYGKAETYISQDVVGWARNNLHVLPDPAHWVVAGYSNGGECALSLGAKFPSVWGNVLDISGEAYPGADQPSRTLRNDFGGNTAAYQAEHPTTILARTHYPDTLGIFTVGSNDGLYRPQAIAMNQAAHSAGWTTTYFEVPNGGHVLGALNGGLSEGFTLLYPRLGLSAPETTPLTPAAEGSGVERRCEHCQ